MNKTEALAERDRLKGLLKAYEDSRVQPENQNCPDPMRVVIPDRAAKVRARIADLDVLIAGGSEA